MGKIVIQDTADVVITDLVSGKVVLNAEAQLAQVTGSISEEDLKGGIGNKKLFKIRTDKEINLTMRSAVADPEYWAMTQGVEIDEAGVASVTMKHEGTVEENADGSFFIALPKGAKAGKAQVEIKGVQETVDVVADAVDPAKFVADLSTIVATVAEGDELVVFYGKEVVGRQIKIDSSKFSSKYRVEYKTIAYDLDTAKVISDIHFDFPETIPSGEFDISLENGSVYTPEISFSVMNPKGSNVMGQITFHEPEQE